MSKIKPTVFRGALKRLVHMRTLGKETKDLLATADELELQAGRLRAIVAFRLAEEKDETPRPT